MKPYPPNSPTEGKSWYSAIENKINKMYDDVRWLVRVLREAESRIERDIQPAAKRSDEALYGFIQRIHPIYQELAVNPKAPYFDAIADQEEGEFLKFLDACLRPLGVNKTHSALRGLYRRAIGPMLKPHKNRRHPGD